VDVRNGKRFQIPACRRLSWDLLHFNKQVPLCGHDRRMDLRNVFEARRSAPVRIGWPTLFLKAFALVAVQIPEFRQTWYRWPWAHLYQHPTSTAAMTMERIVGDDRWLFWVNIPSPQELSLTDIQSRLDWSQSSPVETAFAKQWQLAHLPTILRRILWWFNINVASKARAKRLGTFFLSTLASRGAEIQIPPSIHTCCLTYGPLDPNANCRVTLAYDHRVMDGALVADGLKLLEKILTTVIVDELKSLSIPSASHDNPSPCDNPSRDKSQPSA
jgi:hypothetical protein